VSGVSERLGNTVVARRDQEGWVKGMAVKRMASKWAWQSWCGQVVIP
jgi:hypothetical protein